MTAKSSLSRTLLPLMLVFFLSACSFSLAEDIIPPSGAQQQSAPQDQPVTISGPLYPIVPPDPASGASIYADKCAPCHGEQGMGDGPRAVQLNVPVIAIGSTEIARQATPAEWYTIVTQGNLDRFMPPFNSLSDRQKWDVLAYVFSLSTSAEAIAQGKELYQQDCAKCHGEDGKGDGPDADGLSTQPKDLTDQALMAEKTAAGLYEVISNGVMPDMPAYSGELSEDQRWALVDYLRSLTFVTAIPEETPPPTEIQAAQPYPYPGPAESVMAAPVGIGTINVQLISGSGGEVPSDASVTIYAFEDMQNVFSQTLTMGEDGVYKFPDVELPTGRVFLAGVEYAGGTYGSDISIVEEGITEMTLEVIVYNTTTDTSLLSADRAHIFFDFSSPDIVQVVEVFIISNPTDQSVVPAEEDGAVISFILPQGATNLQFQDGVLGDRYLEIPGGFADTATVAPGMSEYQVVFAFDMPYTNKLEFAQPININTNAIVVMLPDVGIKVKSDQLTEGDVRDMQGTKYRIYNSGMMNVGDHLQFNLSGQPKVGGSVITSSGSTQNLAIGLGVFGLALVLAGVWLYRRNQKSQIEEELVMEPDSGEAGPLGREIDENPDTLMDAILALDDLYKDGKLPEEAYLQRRAELKERLRILLDH